MRLIAMPAALLASTGPAMAAGSLEQLLDRYYGDYLRLEPLTATYIGDPRHNDRLPANLARADVARFVALHRHYLRKLQAIDRATLTQAQQVSYDIFGYECQDIR
jgi:uncharacterized protein (DUF885 family)